MTRPDRLPCGVHIDDLLTQVAEDAPTRDATHERDCPHCRAALTEIRTLWSPLADLAAERVEAPAKLRASVMTRIRELPRNAWHAVVRGERGSTFTASRVISQVARMAAEGIPAVTLAFGSGRPSPLTAATQAFAVARTPQVGVAGQQVVIDVHLVVAMGTHIPSLARLARARIRRHLVDLVGLAPTEVNIVVVDVSAPD